MASSSTTKSIHGFRFAELNLRHMGNKKNTIDLVNRAIRMGYDAVAINIDVGDPFVDRIQQTLEDEEVPKKKRKQQKRVQNEEELDIFPTPFKVNISDLNPVDLKRLESEGKVFRQFSRVTLTLSDSTSVYKMMNHPKIKLFDLVAIRISDTDFLTTLARKGDVVDIVTFDPCDSQRQSWMCASKQIQAVAAEGIAFELTYGNALNDSANRRLFFANSRLLMENTQKGRNVFLSSGSTDIIQIRGPYDVANMSCLIGLDSYKGIHLVSNTPKNILLRSQARHFTIKGAINVADLEHVPHRDKIPVEALKELLKVEEFRKQAENGQENDADKVKIEIEEIKMEVE
uniref:Ribonuclease P protein subunit p30 n=1 Tax=Panagrolaimus superbus TaxID=310955 RepID=A0A914YQH5_9BILA